MADIVEFPSSFRSNIGSKRRDVEPRAVLDGLCENVDDLEILLVVGVDKDGKIYGACSSFDTGDAVLLLERLKRKLLSIYGDDPWRG